MSLSATFIYASKIIKDVFLDSAGRKIWSILSEFLKLVSVK